MEPVTESASPLDLEDGSELGLESLELGVRLGSGLKITRHQETLEPFSLAARHGRYAQCEIKNKQGRLKITSAAMTTAQGDRAIAVKS